MSERIPFGTPEHEAFNKLKASLCQAANEPLRIIDMKLQFTLFVDASEIAAGAVLAQSDEGGRLRPVAFASCKFTTTQQRWSTIERDA
jgi:hypothetical protein